MIFFDEKYIKPIFYLALKNEIDNFTHPSIKNRHPNGVINQIVLGSICKVVITYNDPEKKRIPKKKNKLIVFLTFCEKSGSRRIYNTKFVFLHFF